jgi:hypothetical protein
MPRKLILDLALILILVSMGLTQDVTFNKTRYSSLKLPREVGIVLKITNSKIVITGRQVSKKVGPIDLEIPVVSLQV